jgi:hypothetical protein
MKKRGGYIGGSTVVGPASSLLGRRLPSSKKPKGSIDPAAPWPAELQAEMHRKIDEATRSGGSARGLGTPEHLKKKSEGQD